MFEQFEAATPERQMPLSRLICKALNRHIILENELFYPAIRDSLDQPDLLEVAAVEHEVAAVLVRCISEDDLPAARLRAMMDVLRTHIAHHVENEERQIFRRVRTSGANLERIGEELRARATVLG